MTETTLDIVLAGLMRRYKRRVPDVQTIIDAMIEDGLVENEDDIQNDHVAFRTMGVPRLGIGSLEKIFLHYGYERRDYYDFERKKLDAHWYSPPAPEYPRIFISQLRVDELTGEAQGIIRSYTDEVPSDPVDDLDLDDGDAVDAFLHSGLWRLPTWKDYRRLSDESEYAAWVIYNRYYLNHFTISVHALPAPYDTIPAFNNWLEGHGIDLNDSGGKVKESADGKLRQSSTVSEMIDAEFADGDVHRIAGSYVEFAERRVLDEFADVPTDQIRREHRRDGFEAGNADRIFESTYASQTQRSG
ncbi:MAG: DUF1338 domain-containing protein [Gemmatimonadota bacterium]